jgi:hypothetical protein
VTSTNSCSAALRTSVFLQLIALIFGLVFVTGIADADFTLVRQTVRILRGASTAEIQLTRMTTQLRVLEEAANGRTELAGSRVARPFQLSGRPTSSRTTSQELIATKTGFSAADEIQNTATGSGNKLGPGRGPVYGTKVHTEFANQLKALGRTDITTEVSYLNGVEVPYGTAGSVHLDAVVGSPSAPTAIYDLKTGSAALSPSRIAQIRANLPPGYQNVPVLEVRP